MLSLCPEDFLLLHGHLWASWCQPAGLRHYRSGSDQHHLHPGVCERLPFYRFYADVKYIYGPEPSTCRTTRSRLCWSTRLGDAHSPWSVWEECAAAQLQWQWASNYRCGHHLCPTSNSKSTLIKVTLAELQATFSPHNSLYFHVFAFSVWGVCLWLVLFSELKLNKEQQTALILKPETQETQTLYPHYATDKCTNS